MHLKYVTYWITNNTVSLKRSTTMHECCHTITAQGSVRPLCKTCVVSSKLCCAKIFWHCYFTLLWWHHKNGNKSYYFHILRICWVFLFCILKCAKAFYFTFYLVKLLWQLWLSLNTKPTYLLLLVTIASDKSLL